MVRFDVPCISKKGHYRDSPDVGYCYYCGLIFEEWEKKNKPCRNPADKSKKWKAQVIEIATRYGWGCHYCFLELSLDTATQDHVIPLSKDGSRKKRNVVLACSRCNNKKGDRDVEDFVQSDWLKRRRIEVQEGRAA